MFKFKMLTKVLVAVFFFGQIIELNLNLCIALSIDLSSPRHQIELNNKVGLREHHQLDNTGANMQEDTDSQEAMLGTSFASRTLGAASTSSSSSTVIEDTNKNVSNERTVNNSFKVKNKLVGSNQQQAGQIRTPLVQRLESNGRYNYFGKVFVGEQQVPFYTLFDLTSASFWLVSSECKSNYCLSRQKYNRTSSVTYKPGTEPNLNVEFGNDRGLTLKGRVSMDTVTFAGVEIEQQAFVEVMELDGSLLSMMPVDAFMGLGFKDISQSDSDSTSNEDANQLMNPIERLWRMGLIKEPIFSFKIKNEVEQYSYSNDNGELILGEIAQEYEPHEFTWVPVTHPDYWEFHLEGVAVRSALGTHELERGCEFACPAILDTRYAVLAGHFTDVDRINKALGGFAVGGGVYRLSQCDSGLLPNLVFKFGGNEFVLTPEEYVEVRRVRGTVQSCYSSLVVVNSEDYPFWILGEYFLKRHYVVFDYGQKRIGFARSKTIDPANMGEKMGRAARHIGWGL